MPEEHSETRALALPDEAQFRRDIQAINRFQGIVHQNLIPNQDYGIIPGTQKPTLLKPGAEKIAKLLGLADQYEIMDKREDWDKPFFRYLIKCKLVHVASQVIISEGLGECNSLEGKYRYRWVGDRDLPAGTDKNKLVSQERRTKTGGHWTVYRLDNEDIYSQVNTLIKMAKKRALVDAALSAGRLSNIFTQDIEDIHIEPQASEAPIPSAREPLSQKVSSMAVVKPPPIPLTPEEKENMQKFIDENQAERDADDFWPSGEVKQMATPLQRAEIVKLIKQFTETGKGFDAKGTLTKWGWIVATPKELTAAQATRLLEEAKK